MVLFGMLEMGRRCPRVKDGVLATIDRVGVGDNPWFVGENELEVVALLDPRSQW